MFSFECRRRAAACDPGEDTFERRIRVLGFYHPDTRRSANHLHSYLSVLGEHAATEDLQGGGDAPS